MYLWGKPNDTLGYEFHNVKFRMKLEVFLDKNCRDLNQNKALIFAL